MSTTAQYPSPPAPANQPAEPVVRVFAALQARLLELLRGQAEPLFAILDAARDPKVLQILRASKEEFQSLYEGQQGEELAELAPYLVSLPKDSKLLEMLVCEAWGKSWVAYFVSASPFSEVRRHFRHFLIVEDEAGKKMYFRFYDPRVLRVYLPTCTGQETVSFFGPIARFFCEAKNAELVLEFVSSQRAVLVRQINLS